MPNATIFHRFRTNTLSFGYGQLVTLAVQLLLVPFFLRHWGKEGYADWLVLTGIPLALVLLDLGVSQALASTATAEASAGRRHDASCSLQTALAFTLVLCSAVMSIGLIAAVSVDWAPLLGLHTLSGHDAALVVALMTGYLCAGLLCGPLDALFRTIDRTSLGAIVLANRRVLDVVVSLVVLARGGHAVQLAATMLAGQLLATASIYVLAARVSPWRILGLSSASWRVFRSTLKPALAYAGFPVAQVVTLQGGLQVLNQVASPGFVVGFSMTRTLVRLILQVGVVANNALKPEISRMQGQGRMAEAFDFTQKASATVLAGCMVLYLAFALAGPAVIEFWGNYKVAVRHADVALVGLHVLANVAWFVPASFLIGTNRHVRLSAAYGATSCIALAAWSLACRDVPPVVGASLVLLLPEVAAVILTTSILRRFKKSSHV